MKQSANFFFATKVVLPYRVYLMYAQSQSEMDEWKEKIKKNGALWEGKLRHQSRIMEDGYVSSLLSPHFLTFPFLASLSLSRSLSRSLSFFLSPMSLSC